MKIGFVWKSKFFDTYADIPFYSDIDMFARTPLYTLERTVLKLIYEYCYSMGIAELGANFSLNVTSVLIL